MNPEDHRRRGDHGKRNDNGFSILMDILTGHNTSEELKDIYSHKMTLEEAKKFIEELDLRFEILDRILGIHPRNGAGNVDNSLEADAIGFQESHNKEIRISKKAVDYHLRHLTNEGLIAKRKGRYYLNFRSAKAVRRILELMQLERYDLHAGFHRLMETWVSIAGVEIKDVIADPEGMRDRFTEYTIEFMSYPKNMRDFYLAWTVPSVYVRGIKAREELESRYRDYFNIEKHYFNWNNFNRNMIENEAKRMSLS